MRELNVELEVSPRSSIQASVFVTVRNKGEKSPKTWIRGNSQFGLTIYPSIE
jgi:hypothetical protein